MFYCLYCHQTFNEYYDFLFNAIRYVSNQSFGVHFYLAYDDGRGCCELCESRLAYE